MTMHSSLSSSFRVGVLVACALFSFACAAETEDERAAPWSRTPQELTGSTDEAAPRPRCEEGAQRDCQIIIDVENGVIDCWQGVQFCVDERWSDCLIEDAPPSIDPG